MSKIYLEWQLAKSSDGAVFSESFPASVPGNAQLDYAKAMGFADDWFFGDNFHKFDGLEDCFWKYSTSLPKLPSGCNFFIAKGIDYRFDIFLDGKKIYSQEGMFAPVRVDLDGATEGSKLEVLIYPAPKHPIANIYALDQSRIPLGRSEADRSVKPAVCYGWDFHPRLIVQGIWDEAFIENLPSCHIVSMDFDYSVREINGEEGTIRLSVNAVSTGKCVEYSLIDYNEKVVATNDNGVFEAKVSLWFPHNMGNQPVYTLRALLKDADGKVLHAVDRKVGFRKVQLLMNKGSWDMPNKYPMTRSACPFTLCINDQEVFAKGSNFVNPEVFVGTLNKEHYRSQLSLAKECNMNILRLWGGAIVNKDCFFDICDELGIMVWQEFPLACNHYEDEPSYLKVLEQEATAIVKRVKSHPSVVIWCGGNELFNSWSLMTDQSLALRLLNKICLELDPLTPFLPTSPVFGVKHGPYSFTLYGQDVFHLFNDNDATGYVEFGMSSMSSIEELRKFMPASSLEKIENTQSWRDHHAFEESWKTSGHADYDSVTKFFGQVEDVEAFIERSHFLTCAGYIYVFEEARRQENCSMAMNWCFNEPWYCAANNSLVGYGNVIKPTYYAVQSALSTVTPSLRMARFDYKTGDKFVGEVHILNDGNAPSGIDTVEVFIEGKDRKKIATLLASSSDKNEFCGKIEFTVDDTLSYSLDAPTSPIYSFVNIVLKTKRHEKKYPIAIAKEL